MLHQNTARQFAFAIWLLSIPCLAAADGKPDLLDVNAAQPDGSTALAWAAHRDDLETARFLLQSGARVNAADNYGVTPLALACENASAAMVGELLKAGADPDTTNSRTGETALMKCSRTGNPATVSALLAAGAGVNRTETGAGQSALMWAAAERHADVVKLLVEHGAAVSARSRHGFTPLLFAAQQGDVDTARILLHAGAKLTEATPDGDTVLLVAADNNREDFSIFALNQGADANAANRFGLTALHFAVLRGLPLIRGGIYHSFLAPLWRPNMPRLAQALLGHGANPNPRISGALPANRFYRDERGKISYLGATPFLLACATNDLSMMRALVDAGADPRLGTIAGTTPLMVAAGLGNKQLPTEDAWNVSRTSSLAAVKLLVEWGADLNAVNAEGQTALHAAAHKGLNEVIQFLVEKGSRVDAKDKYGQTPWSIAAFVVFPGVDRDWSPTILNQSTADLLVKLGANPTLAGAAPGGH